MANLRIHPAIGVARVGDSDQFFIGPESPGVPGNWDSGTSSLNRSKTRKARLFVKPRGSGFFSSTMLAIH